MKPSMMIQSMLCFFFALAVTQAHAITITPSDYDFWETDYSTYSNPDADDVEVITGTEDDLLLCYKADHVLTGETVSVTEEGSYSGSYETVFSNTSVDPEDATITWDRIPSSEIPDAKFLLVKDGSAVPIWYLFDIQF